MNIIRRLVSDYLRFDLFQKFVFWIAVVGLITLGISRIFETNFGVITFVGTILTAGSGAVFTTYALVLANREPIYNKTMFLVVAICNFSAVLMAGFFYFAALMGFFKIVGLDISKYLQFVGYLTIPILIWYIYQPFRNFQKHKNIE